MGRGSLWEWFLPFQDLSSKIIKTKFIINFDLLSIVILLRENTKEISSIKNSNIIRIFSVIFLIYYFNEDFFYYVLQYKHSYCFKDL